MTKPREALPGLQIVNSLPEHAVGVSETVREAYGVAPNEACDDCMTPAHVCSHIRRFPEGQFAAVVASDYVVGMATTMRTTRAPSEEALGWQEAIGALDISAHEVGGDWLYGVEMAVRPSYRRRGIGTRLYQARFQLVQSLNLRGWYAVGMLMGYGRYANRMDVVAYGNKVIARELIDPTVTMQMNRGLRAVCVVTDYIDEAAAGNAGVLIVWENPDHKAGAAFK